MLGIEWRIECLELLQPLCNHEGRASDKSKHNGKVGGYENAGLWRFTSLWKWSNAEHLVMWENAFSTFGDRGHVYANQSTFALMGYIFQVFLGSYLITHSTNTWWEHTLWDNQCCWTMRASGWIPALHGHAIQGGKIHRQTLIAGEPAATWEVAQGAVCTPPA